MKRHSLRHHLTHKVETPYCVECWERKWNRTWTPWAMTEPRDGGSPVGALILIGALFAMFALGLPAIGGWFAPVIPSLKGMVIPVLIATAALSYIALAKRHETLTKVVIVVGLTITILIGAA